MCGSRHALGGPTKYRTLNSFSNIEELKHTLMHKCTGFSAARPFHRFFMPAWSGFKGYHKHCRTKTSSDRTSKKIDGVMHCIQSVSAHSLNLSQVKDSGTQIHDIRYYIAEKKPVSIQW